MSLLYDRLDHAGVFARLRASDDPDIRAGARFIEQSIPVFEITNVSHLANRLDCFDTIPDTISALGTSDRRFVLKPEAFPTFGQPYVSYWMEFRVPANAEIFQERLDRIGVWCARFGSPDALEAGFGLFAGARKPFGLAEWHLPYESDGTISSEMSSVRWHRDDSDAIIDRLHGRARRKRDGLDDDVLSELDRRARIIAAEQGPEAAVAFLREKRAEADTELETVTQRQLHTIDDYLRFLVLPPLLLAHSLLACKNVGTEDHAPPVKLAKARKRRSGQPSVRFKTLTITPTGGTRERGERVELGGGQTALHLVRGHFKTFTVERPLFGRHSGTYWWSPMVRGDESAGVVVKDYRVAT